MTFEVQQTRWDRIIRRVSGSIGPGSRVSETLSELFPVLDVERVPGELLILGGTNICIGAARFNAGATDLAFAQLQNPVDSGTIVTLSSFTYASATLGVLRWGRTNTALGTAVGTETFRDTRRPITERPTAKIRQGDQAAVVGGNGLAMNLALTTFQNTDPNGIMVLGPGALFEIGSEATSAEILVTFYWRERPAQESELQF